MTGFLADLGLDEIDEDPNRLPDGPYNAYLTDAKVVTLKDAAKGKRLVLTYKIADGPHKGKIIDEWKGINAFDDARSKAFLKQRILSLGVPEDKISTLDLNDLVGLEVRITKKQNGQYQNINNVTLGHAGLDATESSASADVSDLL